MVRKAILKVFFIVSALKIDCEDLKSDRPREREGRRLKGFVSNICKD